MKRQFLDRHNRTLHGSMTSVGTKSHQISQIKTDAAVYFLKINFMTGQRMRTSIERSTAQKQTATGRKDFYITSFGGQPVESVRYLRAVLNLNLVTQISYH